MLRSKISAINELLQKEVLSEKECIAIVNLLVHMNKYDENILFAEEDKAKQILETVAFYYGITVSEIKSKCRDKHIAEARQIAAYLCKSYSNLPLDCIGRVLGGRDQATIIHGIKKIADRSQNDERLKDDIDVLQNILLDKANDASIVE